MKLVWVLLIPLFYQPASGLLTIACVVRCTRPPTVPTRDFCADCVDTANLKNPEVCLHSCKNVLYGWLYQNVCDRCVKHASLSNRLCVQACQNSESSEFEAICDRCVDQIFPDHVFCSYACQQKSSYEFQDVCDKCANYPWDLRFYE